MALTSSSTLTDALAQLNNNLAWEGSATKAADALEAVRWLLFNRAKIMANGGTSYNFEELAEMEKKLDAYVSKVGTSNRTSFTRGRMLLE